MPTTVTSVPYTPTFLNDASMAKFSTARYDRMVNDGILTPDDNVELLENYVVLKMSKNPLHDCGIETVDEALRPVLPAGWRLRSQSALDLSDSRPEPDCAVVRGGARTRRDHHFTPADTGLVIEVANTSLLRDQRDKARIYARAGVVCYWIVNLEDRRVEVHARPSGPCESPAYATVQNYGVGESVPLVLDGVAVATIAVAELLL